MVIPEATGAGLSTCSRSGVRVPAATAQAEERFLFSSSVLGILASLMQRIDRQPSPSPKSRLGHSQRLTSPIPWIL